MKPTVCKKCRMTICSHHTEEFNKVRQTLSQAGAEMYRMRGLAAELIGFIESMKEVAPQVNFDAYNKICEKYQVKLSDAVAPKENKDGVQST